MFEALKTTQSGLPVTLIMPMINNESGSMK
jgi:hypothetical protein